MLEVLFSFIAYFLLKSKNNDSSIYFWRPWRIKWGLFESRCREFENPITSLYKKICNETFHLYLTSWLLLRGFNHLSRTTFFFSKWWSRADNYHEIFFLIHIKYTLCKCNTFFLIFPSKYWCLTIWFQSMTHSSKRKTLPECIPLPEKHNANSNKKKLKQKNKKIWRFEQKQTLLWNPSYNKQVFLPKWESCKYWSVN